MPYTPGTFCWYELATTDTDGAKTFYGSLLGWQFEDMPMPGDMGGTYTMIRKDGKDVGGLYKLAGPMFEGVPPNWGGYVAVDDVDAVADKAKASGGALLYDPMDAPGIGRMCMVRGPEGAVVSMFKGASDSGNPADKLAQGSFSWSELMTDNTDTSGAFYTGLFGWAADPMDMGPAGTYHVMKAGEDMAAGMMAITPQMGPVPPHWMHYITVKNVDDIAAKATAAGGETLVPPTDIPNIGRFACIKDPQGAAFSAITYVPVDC